MQIRYNCQKSPCVAIIEYGPLEEAGSSIECPRCHESQALHVTAAMRDEEKVDRCAVCQCRELFIRKDFPQGVGLAVVLIAGIASIILFRSNLLLAYGALATAMLVDLGFYLCVGKVTTCYACRAEYRNGQLNSAHDGFDLGTSEKY